ncbi:reverse transcriptase domain-containing protein [Tanacetum coccineum]
MSERHTLYIPPQRPSQEFHRPKTVLTLDSLSSTPQKILATEHQLHLPQPAPLVGVPSKENLNRYIPRIQQAKSSDKGRKAKGKRRTVEQWPAEGEGDKHARDLSEEALVVEAEVEGYLVRMIHIDEGASVEIMFEHCFNMLHPSIRSKLVGTQTTVFGFLGEQVKPLRKIKLDVCFIGGRRCQREIMKFTIIPAPSPYNIIMGRPRLKQLRAIPSTIHGMMKFPTPLGVSTVLSQAPVVFECRSK